jgi:osmotically-inducible protein OsmY
MARIHICERSRTRVILAVVCGIAVGGVVQVSAIASTQLQNSVRVSQQLNGTVVAEKIEEAFAQDELLRRFDLDAKSDSGNTIVLSGILQTETQKRLAETIARRLAIGFQVVNQITLQPDLKPIWAINSRMNRMLPIKR